MSGDPSRPTDCSEVLGHLYEYLDKEMPDVDSAKFQEHIEECRPCLAEYGLEESVKKLVKRCCGHDEVPADLRAKVLDRIELIRGTGPGQTAAGGGAVPPAATAD
ncbi:mycothiol system anti-sigma-R factor [Streptomyces sp. NPDC059853]|uniref:mycothiol system anti-sigma-R factor n=1 Tax=Streptomyces sp. NPDC059853 TaxID=3346973 RepID=UPI0036471ADF